MGAYAYSGCDAWHWALWSLTDKEVAMMWDSPITSKSFQDIDTSCCSQAWRSLFAFTFRSLIDYVWAILSRNLVKVFRFVPCKNLCKKLMLFRNSISRRDHQRTVQNPRLQGECDPSSKRLGNSLDDDPTRPLRFQEDFFKRRIQRLLQRHNHRSLRQ